MIRVTVPTRVLLDRLGDLPADVQVLEWDWTGPAPVTPIDIAVMPYMGPLDLFAALEGSGTRVVQVLTIGYDGMPERLPPGALLANAAGVHEASTAELAMGLILAVRRNLPRFIRDQDAHRWAPVFSPGLRNRRVLVIGAGGVASALVDRLLPFGVEVVRVARTARTDERGPVHGIDELRDLLPGADVVVLCVPLTDETRGLVDAGFLAAMRDGSLLVNVARGPVVDTAALLAELRSGRITAALDVVDPEPLPPDHPLWDAPGLLLVPHVGGKSDTLDDDAEALIRRQVAALRAGEPPINLVARADREA